MCKLVISNAAVARLARDAKASDHATRLATLKELAVSHPDVAKQVAAYLNGKAVVQLAR